MWRQQLPPKPVYLPNHRALLAFIFKDSAPVKILQKLFIQFL
jgi:hypothetical protein